MAVPILLSALQHHAPPELERTERLPSPVVLLPSPAEDDWETALLWERPDSESEETRGGGGGDDLNAAAPPGTLIDALADGGVVEIQRDAARSPDTVARVLGTNAVSSIFVIGDARRLEVAVAGAIEYRGDSNVRLYSTIYAGYLDPDIWRAIAIPEPDFSERRITLDGRTLEPGIDAEIAAIADADAALAFELERLIDELMPR